MPRILEQIVEVSLLVATHVVDHNSGMMFSPGFAADYAPHAVFPTSRRMEKCAQSMLPCDDWSYGVGGGWFFGRY